ncbi:MAG: cation diffusion facilitator family transporter [Proteobacteria bacterium]|nr:cation diffusion facilitator family transporter [Pseudomonadota bacterium]
MEHRPQTGRLGLSLGALGIVYGDIGTSPLYAFQSAFSNATGVTFNPQNVLGSLSLIFWALVLMVSIKCVALVLRADNDGEGGILALMALVMRRYGAGGRRRVASGALVAKELLFRYMLSVAKRVKSSMLVANAWHARSDAASSLVVGSGIIGNLAGYPILDPIAALIIGFMVAKMGWSFGWDAMHDLMDRSVDEQEVTAIRKTLVDTPGVESVHDIRRRKMGDMIVVDAHIEVDAAISVEAGHDIAVEARKRVPQRHRVLKLMTHVDPWRRPDLDHAGTAVRAS